MKRRGGCKCGNMMRVVLRVWNHIDVVMMMMPVMVDMLTMRRHKWRVVKV
jgi:hypothetical protein